MGESDNDSDGTPPFGQYAPSTQNPLQYDPLSDFEAAHALNLGTGIGFGGDVFMEGSGVSLQPLSPTHSRHLDPRESAEVDNGGASLSVGAWQQQQPIRPFLAVSPVSNTENAKNNSGNNVWANGREMDRSEEGGSEGGDSDGDAPLGLIVETAPLLTHSNHSNGSGGLHAQIELALDRMRGGTNPGSPAPHNQPNMQSQPSIEASARKHFSTLKSALSRTAANAQSLLNRQPSPTRLANTGTPFQRSQSVESRASRPQRDYLDPELDGRSRRPERPGRDHFPSPPPPMQEPEDEDITLLDKPARALRIWANIDNLDEFLERIYVYFQEKGFHAVILSRVCNLLILGFMIIFSTFIFSCIDHSRIHKHKQLSEVIVPQCLKTIPAVQAFFLVLFGIWWLWQFFHLILDVPKLFEIKLVYEHLLDIKESDMDTVEWQEVVHKLTLLKLNPSSNPRGVPGLDRLDAHTIVNRIMRKDNYLIAMFNKDVLNLRLPRLFGTAARGGLIVTKILEWNLYFAVLLYAFDEKGALRKKFLKARYRRRLVVGLQKRFELMAILNLMFSPFLLAIMLLYFLFKYAEEYQKSPSSLSVRQFTQQAQWKLREFNELPHTFQTRLNRAYPKACAYLNQFRKQKLILAARLVSFLCGSIVAALAMLAIVDHELTDFEITPGRSALFYMTLFGGGLAVARGMIPEDFKVFEPERLLKEVIEETHYLPNDWRGRLHSEEVKTQFSSLFTLQITQFLVEILSVLLAPFILYYSLPATAESVIDFFRDFTVDMDGVGFVCSFAAFDLTRNGNPRYGVPVGGDHAHVAEHNFSREGKMEQSFLYFKANYPQWDAGAEGSQYLQALSRSQRFASLKPESSVLFDPAGGKGKRNVKFGGQNIGAGPSSSGGPGNGIRLIYDSRLGVSEYESGTTAEEDEPLGIFGILDAVYEANTRTRL
ncbi:autophagy protein Apg9-domain-containing protein [Chytriomyces sp. MP71]|nr:autophagy protein Apg9-domain-containing protein [Chytriomyces sp. MP71]